MVKTCMFIKEDVAQVTIRRTNCIVKKEKIQIKKERKEDTI